MLWSLCTLNLSTANFDSDESVSLLALILAKAQQINQVDITVQQGDRIIDVRVDEEREWQDEKYLATFYLGGIIFGSSEEIIILERGE